MYAAQSEEAKEEDLVGLTQRQMAVKVDLRQQKLLLQDLRQEEVREQAWLASGALPHAGDWLNTASLTALVLHL